MMGLALAVLIGMGAPALAAAEAGSAASDSSLPAGSQLGEDLFKWGEYDSLIRVLEPAMAASVFQSGSGTAADSAFRAKSYLFLGVAFYATGKRERSDSAFGRACELDPRVKLDRFYVTEEIAGHFQAIAQNAMRNRESRAALAMASRVMEYRSDGDSTRSPVRAFTRAGRTGVRDKGKTWLWWGLGVTALAAAGGGAYYIGSQMEPPSTPTRLTTIDAR